MLKRKFDFCLAAIVLAAFFPLLMALALAVRVYLGSPVFFVQRRTGYNGKTFAMYKFRTMNEAYDTGGRPLSDDQRMPSFGAFLRKTSLDELPELWNILRGDMSFVGPRPLLPEYLPLYNERQNRRHEVRPGLTGWAQVNGRNSISWEERFELDIWYVENHSLRLDLVILLSTVLAVATQRGVSPADQQTMPPFAGSKPKQNNIDLSLKL